jgi:OmpA-OmpF porin, OOP family
MPRESPPPPGDSYTSYTQDWRGTMRLKPATLLTALALLAAPRALAQGVPGLELERLRLDPSAAGSLVIGNGEVGRAGASRTSLSVGFQRDPLVLLTDGTLRGRGVAAGKSVVGAVVDGRVTAALGVSLALVDRFEVFLRVPYVAWQHGFNLTDRGIAKPANNGPGAPSGGLRLGVVSQSEGAPLSVAVAAEVLPSWGTEAAVAGNQGFAWSPRIEVGRRMGGFALGAMGYAFFREAGIPLRSGEIAGNEYGGGLALSSTGDVRAELSWRFAVNEYKLSFSSEALAGVRASAGPVELFALAGPGIGAAPGTPTWRGLVGIALAGAPK